jgi:hypothetical protein
MDNYEKMGNILEKIGIELSNLKLISPEKDIMSQSIVK